MTIPKTGPLLALLTVIAVSIVAIYASYTSFKIPDATTAQIASPTPQAITAKIRANCANEIGVCFTSLSAWQAAYGGINFGSCTPGDLVCANIAPVVQMYNDWPNGLQDRVTLNGWKTDVNHPVLLTVAEGHRHKGKARSGFWLRGTVRILSHNIWVSYFDIRGQILVDGGWQSGNGARIGNSLVHDFTAPGASLIQHTADGSTISIANSTVYGINQSGWQNGGLISTKGAFIYNVTGIGSTKYGIRVLAGTVDVHNTYMGACAAGCYVGTFAQRSDNNVSSDTTAPGTTRAINKKAYASYFKSAVFGQTTDLHLTNTSLNLWGVPGQNFSAYYNLDIDTQQRSAWDIGADEFGNNPKWTPSATPSPSTTPLPTTTPSGTPLPTTTPTPIPTPTPLPTTTPTPTPIPGPLPTVTILPDLALCSGLVQDKTSHPMTSISKPSLGGTIIDPQFGTTIRRITAVPTSEGENAIIKPMYSTIQAWNADESKLILWHRSKGHELYDGKTYQFIKQLSFVSPTDLEQIIWDAADPDILYYPSNYNATPNLYRHRISTGVNEVIKNFGSICPTGDWGKLLGLGSDPMYSSWVGNSRVLGLQCGPTKFLYDIASSQILSTTSSTASVAPQPGPSGQFAYWLGNTYNAALQFLQKLDLVSNHEHASVGRTRDGHDTYNTVVFDTPAGGTEFDHVGSLVRFDLDTGNRKVVIGQSTGWPYPGSTTHISAIAYKRPGWVGVSSVGNPLGQGVLDSEILLANIQSNTVCRVGHHRSYAGTVAGAKWGYWSEPHVVISPSGTRLLFGSDWGNGDSVDSYIIELPSYVP